MKSGAIWGGLGAIFGAGASRLELRHIQKTNPQLDMNYYQSKILQQNQFMSWRSGGTISGNAVPLVAPVFQQQDKQ